MIRKLVGCAFGLTMCAGLQAATVNTSLTVQATGTVGGSGITASGPATLTNIGSGTFSGTVSLSPDPSGNFNAPFTITLTTGDKINGTLKIPANVLSGSGTGSATISG